MAACRWCFACVDSSGMYKACIQGVQQHCTYDEHLHVNNRSLLLTTITKVVLYTALMAAQLFVKKQWL